MRFGRQLAQVMFRRTENGFSLFLFAQRFDAQHLIVGSHAGPLPNAARTPDKAMAVDSGTQTATPYNDVATRLIRPLNRAFPAVMRPRPGKLRSAHQPGCRSLCFR